MKNWKKYSPRGEVQRVNNFEPMSCTSYATCNVLEMLFNYHLGKLTEYDRQWLLENDYIQNGKVNFSDRFLAEMSDTTHSGNYIYKVAETASKVGLVPEKLYPYPKDPTWDKYYKDITDKLEEQGQEFLERFSIDYGWANKKDIKQSPLVVTVYAWKKNEKGLYYKDGDYNHAVTKYRKGDWIFDSYRPFFKHLTPDNISDNGIKFNIQTKSMKLKNKFRYVCIDRENGEKQYGFAKDGKLIVDDRDAILNTWIDENNGDIKRKTISVSPDDFNSVSHYNLKMKKIYG